MRLRNTILIGSICLALLGLFISCKTSVIKEFPDAEPELMYTSLIFEEKCFVRCFDLRKAKTVDPKLCGVGEPQDVEEDLSWEVHFEACDDITGFKTRAWSGRIMPYLEEIDDWVYDNLNLIKEKLNELQAK